MKIAKVEIVGEGIPFSSNDDEIQESKALPEFKIADIPVLPLRNIVILPGFPVPVTIGREESKNLIKEAAAQKSGVFAVAQKEDTEAYPSGVKALYPYGTLCHVIKLLDQPDGDMTAFLFPVHAARLKRIKSKKPYLRGVVESLENDFGGIDSEKLNIPDENDLEMNAIFDQMESVYDKIIGFLGENEARDVKFQIKEFSSNRYLKAMFMMANSPIEVSERVELLAAPDVKERLRMFLKFLDTGYQKMQLKAELNRRTHEEMSQRQKEMFLQTQMRAIQDELGETYPEEDEYTELQERADKKKWSDEQREHFNKELRKLERFNPQTPDYAVQYTYLDNLLSLPWGEYSDSEIDLHEIRNQLDTDHFGLDKVKERIVEHMAVLKLRGDMKSPILCLYGPPGVGKTSLGRSIAKAIGREYVRVSLGGVHDEAEIRGHRRTYLGALPGRILSNLAKCGKDNPVFVLDEIDKLGQDFKGDPSTALLEVLDPEQNVKFHDNYIDVDYDLSKILFIATANSLAPLSSPILDRMELIEINGYAAEEKQEIATRHLVGKVLEDHGFRKGDITFQPESLMYIIDRYTRESGVRQLEKKIAKVIRKIAAKKVSDEPYPEVITPEIVREYLGREEVNPDTYENNDSIGVVTGLAWTAVGGEILFIESSMSEGKGEKLVLTGNLGDVMKESAVIALQYLRANSERFGIDKERLAKADFHIHVPEGAIPKDGPSAGVTMATSLASTLTGRKVRPRLAMTGEITLRGKVLPVGGIQEKVLAAKRAGITDIILCEENRRDIEDVVPSYLEGLTFHYVNCIAEVLDYALLPPEK